MAGGSPHPGLVRFDLGQLVSTRGGFRRCQRFCWGATLQNLWSQGIRSDLSPPEAGTLRGILHPGWTSGLECKAMAPFLLSFRSDRSFGCHGGRDHPAVFPRQSFYGSRRLDRFCRCPDGTASLLFVSLPEKRCKRTWPPIQLLSIFKVSRLYWCGKDSILAVSAASFWWGWLDVCLPFLSIIFFLSSGSPVPDFRTPLCTEDGSVTKRSEFPPSVLRRIHLFPFLPHKSMDCSEPVVIR